MKINSKNCLVCNRIFKAKPVHIRTGRAKFCSKQCKTESQKGIPLSPERRQKFIEAGYGRWAGRKHTPEARQKMSENQRGKFGEAARGWKGGRRIETHGYVKIAGLEIRDTKTGPKRKYVFEHRLVMENHLGRKLFDYEIIHHRNGIKTDNRIENLEIVLRETHRGSVACPHCLKTFQIK